MDCDQSQVKKLAKRSKKDELENKFLAHWVAMYPNLPPPERQHRFHSTRRWRWDFSWNSEMLAVELQGGSWIKGGHNTAYGQSADYEKYNEAVRLGWRVLLYNTPMMKDMASVVDQVAEILCNAKEV